MTGILLVNLGTPENPDPKSVGKYLHEFLSDPDVIDIAAPLRWFLVNVLIVPRRSHASSELYKKIWTDKGSPLLVNLQALAPKVQTELGETFKVKFAMRYGKPSIASALAEFKSAGIFRIKAFPLYPQYSLAATASSIKKILKEARALDSRFDFSFVPAFYSSPEYLDAVAKVSAPYLKEWKHDKVLFSFHGLPERQVKKTDPTGKHCFADKSCCDSVTSANEDCYRAQSYATAREVAKRLAIAPENYVVGFQSRLGRTPWIQPFSDEYYRTLPKQGVKRLAVIVPSFVADCLETLEEVRLRGKEEFVRSGGEDLLLVPSLNSGDYWAKAAAAIVKRGL